MNKRGFLTGAAVVLAFSLVGLSAHFAFARGGGGGGGGGGRGGGGGGGAAASLEMCWLNLMDLNSALKEGRIKDGKIVAIVGLVKGYKKGAKIPIIGFSVPYQEMKGVPPDNKKINKFTIVITQAGLKTTHPKACQKIGGGGEAGGGGGGGRGGGGRGGR